MKHPKRGPHNPLAPNSNDYCLVGDKKKRKYATKLDAELNAPVRTLTQYKCSYCKMWHNANPQK